MALALNNLKRVDMPLNKETKPKIMLIECLDFAVIRKYFNNANNVRNVRDAFNRFPDIFCTNI